MRLPRLESKSQKSRRLTDHATHSIPLVRSVCGRPRDARCAGPRGLRRRRSAARTVGADPRSGSRSGALGFRRGHGPGAGPRRRCLVFGRADGVGGPGVVLDRAGRVGGSGLVLGSADGIRQARGEDGRHQEGGHPKGHRRSKLRSRHVLGERQEGLVTGTVGGVGLGLRWDFVDELVRRTRALEQGHAGGPLRRLPIDFLEVSPENYMGRCGAYPAALAWLAERYPIVTHGLTMSLGGSDALDEGYLGELAGTIHALKSPWHSDHLCVGSVGGRKLHDLLPIAFKDANVGRVAERIERARDAIGVPLAIENISYYWHPGRAEMGEAEFLSRVCAAADCGLVLDVNNAYVNSINFGFDVDEWMRDAPLDRVVQIHVAGHEWFAGGDAGIGESCPAGAADAVVIDTHGADVSDPVLGLLDRVLTRTGRVPVLLERDQNIPSFDELLAEIARIRAIWERA